MVLELYYSTQFKKDLKKAKRSKKDITLLKLVLEKLSKNDKLPRRHREHKLSGNWKDYKELHITPDWLLIYKIDTKKRMLFLARLGSHAELFKL